MARGSGFDAAGRHIDAVQLMKLTFQTRMIGPEPASEVEDIKIVNLTKMLAC